MSFESKKHYLIIKLSKKWPNESPKFYNDIVDMVVQADPVAVRTDNQKTPFVHRIIDWFVLDKIKLPEDIETTREMLTKYNNLHFHNKIQKKVNDYEAPEDLRRDISDVIGIKVQGTYDDLKLVGQVPGYKMYYINDFTQGQKAFEDSGWCVQYIESFNNYKPPFFMVTTSEDKRYALLHRKSCQIKDVHDKALTLEFAKPIIDLVRIVWPKYVQNDDLKKLIELWPEAIQEIKEDPGRAYYYAKDVKEGRWLEAESTIMKDPVWAYKYARDVIKDRWEEAEPTILKNCIVIYNYAAEVIKGRWLEAEPIILNDPIWTYMYVATVVGVRWKEAESVLITNPGLANAYAKCVIKGRWPEAEPYIMKELHIAYTYAADVICGRWPEIEPLVLKSSYWSYMYVRYIIKSKWPEAEPIIAKDDNLMNEYKHAFE